MNKKWQIYETNNDKIEELVKTYKINNLLATILINRGIDSKEKIRQFLEPTRQDFYNSYLMKDMEIAV